MLIPLISSIHIFQRRNKERPPEGGGAEPAPAVLERAGGFLAWGVQSLVDFLVPDACHFCGKRAHDGPGPYSSNLPPATAYLAAKSRAYLLGIFPVESRTFCTRCLAQFEIATRTGLIGSYNPSGRVTTRTGDVFGPTTGTGSGGDHPEEKTLGCTWTGLQVAAPFLMNDISLKTIHLIKFSGRRALVPPVARAVALALCTQVEPEFRDAVLVPVPMDRAAARKRGFNQAELLADEISAATGVPVLRDALHKVLRTPPQSLTKRGRRAENVRHAFAPHNDGVRGKRVLLVDDLVTSGATASACASGLLAVGAGSVTVLCVARAL